LRNQENAAFLASSSDLTSSIAALKEAIEVLADVGADQTMNAGADHTQYMTGNESNFRVVLADLKTALVAASAFVTKKQVAVVDAFLQTPFTGTYTAHSGEVVGILKDMRTQFQADLLNAVDVENVAVKAHGEYIAAKLKEHGAMSESHTEKTGLLASNDASLGTKRSELSTAQSDLAGAESFLSSLVTMCAAKKKQHDERVALRTKEEVAIAEAISILNSDAAFATFGTVTATRDGATSGGPPAGPPGGQMPSFLQHRAVRKHEDPRRRAQAFLQKAAGAKASPLLSRIVSMLQANNPFTVVLDEIQKMEALIATEEQADEDQKQWCDSERTQTDSDILTKEGQIGTLGGEIDGLKIDIDDPQQGLKVIIAQIETSMNENHNNQATETETRRNEHVEFVHDTRNLAEATGLLERATEVLRAYYSKLASEMSGGFLQKRRDEPTPPATWDDTYSGQSVKGGSVIDMLTYILSETKAEETQAHEDEVAAQASYEDRMTQLTAQYALEVSSLATTKEQLAEKELALMQKEKALAATQKEKAALEDYLKQIKPGCDFITTHIVARKSARAAESASLSTARDLIKQTPAYLAVVGEEHESSLGECLPTCKEHGEEHVKCKACLADVTVPGYCAGHPSAEGCVA